MDDNLGDLVKNLTPEQLRQLADEREQEEKEAKRAEIEASLKAAKDERREIKKEHRTQKRELHARHRKEERALERDQQSDLQSVEKKIEQLELLLGIRAGVKPKPKGATRRRNPNAAGTNEILELMPQNEALSLNEIRRRLAAAGHEEPRHLAQVMSYLKSTGRVDSPRRGHYCLAGDEANHQAA
ncbi:MULTISPECIES: hypothetical protein [unclassified Thioalkalivibrio]|uniref:hypothetical protein n=1 Tax=unclassified Thioalkalivibrio TaxID=2621013 RepID=UPI00037CE79C|nr:MULTISPECIES: hypothetical protein [unclassified Thioalkalivibrio]